MAEPRRATAADIPAMMAIRAAVRENRLRALSIDAAAYEPFIAHGCCWIWEEENDVLGFAALDDGAASVWALFVAPAAEGRGIGRALLARLVAEARARGLAALTLETAAGTRAERFYRKAGWTIVGEEGALRLRLIL